MGYSEQIVEQAKKEINNRRSRAEFIAKRKRDELVTACPELIQIEKEISSAGLEAIKAIGMGKNALEFINELKIKNLNAQQKRKELLISLGLEEDFLEPNYICKECEDKGIINGRRCKCFKSLLKKYAYEDLSKCSSIKLSNFEDFKLDYYSNIYDEKDGIVPREQMEQIFNYCKSWAKDFSKYAPSVLMYGSTGLGKTHLSLAMAKSAIDKGYAVVYGSTQNLLSKLEREKFSRSYDNESEKMLLECDLLILDDLGAEFSTSFTTSALYNVINTRMSVGLPVIINTNLTIKDIEVKYTQRILSRIIGNYMPLEFFGSDVRQIKSM